MHTPVLLNEVIDFLKPQPNQNFIDCTIGFGGHAFEILKRVRPNGQVLGLDQDSETLNKIKKQKGLFLVTGNFSDLKKIVTSQNFTKVNGLLFDLGFSSWQMDQSQRGLSFQKNEVLDMRLGKTDLTASEIINHWPEQKIAELLQNYGQERFAKRIAAAVCAVRQRQKITTTTQLVEIIRRTTPKPAQKQKIHFATRTFQALRIAVNDELNNLEKALPQALDILMPRGTLVVISFHSLEDRIVKNFFRNQAKQNLLTILTKKPLQPTAEEINNNPRSRSAKLRASQKI